MSAEDYTTWDPSTDPSCQDEQAAHGVSASRKVLYQIRDRLQRAVIAGGHYNTYERMDDRVDPYVPASQARHPVLHQEDDPLFSKSSSSNLSLAATQKDDIMKLKWASNSATALLLSRQFEALSRKDIQLEEKDELNQLMHAYMQTTRWLLQLEHNANLRRVASQAEEYRRNSEASASTLTGHIIELENACRRRAEQSAEECRSLLDKELSRAFDVLQYGQHGSQRHWIEQQESRGRHNIILDHDRILSRIYAMQIAECQGIVLKSIVQEKLPTNPTALVDGDGSGRRSPGVSRGTNTVPTSPPPQEPTKSRGEGTPRSAPRREPDSKVPRYEMLDEDAGNRDAQLASQIPTGYADSEASDFTPMNYREYWGWMAKSTGVLVTWQRRFFVFTKTGKLKCATTPEGPWQLIFEAPQILRVEVDAYHEGSGARPPADQYHQYGFYVDISGENPMRPERCRFCCYSKGDLNNWLHILRQAVEVVYHLEETHSIAPSPLRIRVDEALLHEGGKHTSYRRRTQLEDDTYALQQARQERAERSPMRRSRSNGQTGALSSSKYDQRAPGF
jgi:hypothetical protein